MTLHADHIGSLLRPPELLEARAAHERGDLGDDAFERAEDAAILKALDLQREVGLGIFSDGEYRRSWFAGGFPSVIEGLVPNDEAISLQWEGAGATMATKVTTEVKLGTSSAGERLRMTGRAHAKETAFLRAHAAGPFKATTTGPLHFVRAWYRLGAADAYPDTASMIDHVVEMLAGEVRAQRGPRTRARLGHHDGAPHVPREQPQLVDPDGRLARVDGRAGVQPAAGRPAAARVRHRPCWRLRVDGAGQPDHLGRPAAQARAGGLRRRGGLGIVTAPSGILAR